MPVLRQHGWRHYAVPVLGALTIVVLMAFPAFASLYWLRVLTGVLMLAVVAQGINIMAGFVGYPAFGNVVFFGLGAYGTAIGVTTYGMPMYGAVVLGILAATLLALPVGVLLLRLRGHYFAIGTLGLNEAMSAIAANLVSVTGGGQGMSLPLMQGTAAEIGRLAYFQFVGLFAASLAVAWFLRVSRFGYACRAIRANEEAAEASGINALVVKTLAWLMSAVLTAVAGGFYARWVGFIEPAVVFDMSISVRAFVMFLIGGAGTVFGPFIGSFVIEGVTTLAWSHLLKAHLLVLGILIMLVVLVLPRGIQAFVGERWHLLRRLLAPGGGR